MKVKIISIFVTMLLIATVISSAETVTVSTSKPEVDALDPVDIGYFACAQNSAGEDFEEKEFKTLAEPGGEVILFVDDIYTAPSSFRPGQEVDISVSYSNCGNRDSSPGEDWLPDIYLDNEIITPRAKINNVIEVNEYYVRTIRYNWPNDLDSHEIKSSFSDYDGSFSITEKAIDGYPDLTCTEFKTRPVYRDGIKMPGQKSVVYTVTNVGNVSFYSPGKGVPIHYDDGLTPAKILWLPFSCGNVYSKNFIELKPGESVTFDFYRDICLVGPYYKHGTIVTIEVDPSNETYEGEDGESNNVASLVVSLNKNSNLRTTPLIAKMLGRFSFFEKILKMVLM
jgi:hypothetical protein